MALRRLDQPRDPRRVVPHRDNYRDIEVRRPAEGARVGDGGIQQGAGQLCADSVVHLEPAAVEHGLCGRSQPQQPGGRTAEQRRTLTQNSHASIDLNGEPVGQPRSGHLNIPS